MEITIGSQSWVGIGKPRIINTPSVTVIHTIGHVTKCCLELVRVIAWNAKRCRLWGVKGWAAFAGVTRAAFVSAHLTEDVTNESWVGTVIRASAWARFFIKRGR